MNNIGYKDDKIFLLSNDEYIKYKDKIKPIPISWWLRSPGSNQGSVAIVLDFGSVCYSFINFDDIVVRPALKYKSIENTIYCYGTTWDKIDNNLYIARMPIAFMRFDKDSNDYETSEVRKFLLDFIK